MIRNCKVVCEVGIDIDLFKLLDWSVASAYPLCTAPYWGLELRSGLGAVIDTSQSLQRSIELALDAVVGIDVQQRPQDASVRWVLLCRSIALGASSSSLKQTSIEPVQDAAVMESDENVDDKRKQPSYTTESAHMTYQQFVTLMREKGALKASPLTSARCRLRYVALQCSTVAILGAGRHHAHYDLHLSRIETQILLKSLPANFTDHDLDTIPCYLALFLQDIVNMACACASFTIEDNKQTALQGAAVDCLNVVVSLFWDSADPDVLRVESGLIGKSNSILELYIAQIVSALRPCLSTQWCPPLLLTSGALLCELLRRSLLKDRTVVRRLLKALTGNCVVEGEQLNIRAAESDEVAEEISTIQYVVNMTNLARIYLLCLDSGLCRNISPEIKTAILSSISPWMDGLTSAWENISLDGVRLLQGYKRWQKAVPETDPRRGGASYSCTAETPKLRGYYEYALPFVTVANLVGRPDVESSFLPASYFILESLLENLAMLPKSQFEVKLFMRSVAESGGFVRLSRSFLEPLLCRGLAIICERFVVANQRSDTDFVEKPEDTAELSRLLLFFGRDVIPNRASPTSNFSDFISLSIEITDALSALLPAIRLTEKLTPQCDDMWCWSWIVAISLLDSLFDDLLVTGGGTATLVNSIRDYALSVESGDNSYSAENEVLFPSIHVCPNVSVDECEKLNGMLSSDVLVNLLNVIIELCRLRRCWKCERFVLELSLTVLSRLSFFSFEAFENSITRKSILAMLPRICMHSGGFSNLETADSAKKLRGSKPSDLLVHSLTEWFHFYNHNGESIRSVFAVSTYRMRAVVDTIFTAWVSIEHVSNFMVKFC